MPQFVRDKFAAQQKKREGQRLVVCVFGFTALSLDILDSLEKDTTLELHLVTRSTIEAQRAEVKGKIVSKLAAVIGKVDFWILVTPFDDELDFRNKTEENLEYIPASTALFTKEKLRELKDETTIANVCNYASSVSLSELLGLEKDV